jgi:hypothetical protein
MAEGELRRASKSTLARQLSSAASPGRDAQLESWTERAAVASVRRGAGCMPHSTVHMSININMAQAISGKPVGLQER